MLALNFRRLAPVNLAQMPSCVLPNLASVPAPLAKDAENDE